MWLAMKVSRCLRFKKVIISFADLSTLQKSKSLSLSESCPVLVRYLSGSRGGRFLAFGWNRLLFPELDLKSMARFFEGEIDFRIFQKLSSYLLNPGSPCLDEFEIFKNRRQHAVSYFGNSNNLPRFVLDTKYNPATGAVRKRDDGSGHLIARWEPFFKFQPS